MTSQETRNRILDAALRLFNDRGTAVISTNHIATEAGISPGNLYYHYRNKEEITREILENMFAAWGGVWFKNVEHAPDVSDLKTLIRLNFQLLWEFRFFYRESTALMLRDPKLATRHAEMQRARLSQQENFYRHFVEAGVMKEPEDSSAISDLVSTTWILATKWLTFLEEGMQEVDEVRMQEGERLILRVFRHYLTDASAVELEMPKEH